MSIGEFTQSLRLQEAVETPDGGGGFTMDWQDMAEGQVFAKIEVQAQTETPLARGIRRPVTCRITLPLRSDVTPMLRLADDSFCYHIMSLQQAGDTLTITALRSPL